MHDEYNEYVKEPHKCMAIVVISRNMDGAFFLKKLRRTGWLPHSYKYCSSQMSTSKTWSMMAE
jgi:hypothetical protein